MNGKQESLSTFDKTLLNLVQTDFPLAERPFAVLAERLKVDEALVICRLAELKAAGFIRRIGLFFDSRQLGFVSTLAAVEVDEARRQTVAEAINAFPGVTHNYEREGEFALWFTLISANEEEERAVLESIAALPGVKRLINLPASRRFKADVCFWLE